MSKSTIADLRKKFGLTQTELARRMGVTKMAISRWEAGLTKSLSAQNLLKAASVLQVDPKELLFEQDAPSDSLLPHEQKLLDQVRSLPEKERKAVETLIAALSASRTLGAAD